MPGILRFLPIFCVFCLDFGCSLKAPAHSFDLAWLRAIISIAMVFKQNKKGPSQLRVPSHSQGLLLPQNELWGAHLGAAVITIQKFNIGSLEFTVTAKAEY